MKMILVMMMLVGQSAMALDMSDLQSGKLTEQAKAKAQGVIAACKEDKVKYCDKYTEMNALKECFTKNKASLSEGCKASVGIK